MSKIAHAVGTPTAQHLDSFFHQARAENAEQAVLAVIGQASRTTRRAVRTEVRRALSVAPDDRQAWLTPRAFILQVLSALGIAAVSLDVACDGPGTSNVPALAHYTKDDAAGDGLSRPWRGAVLWMNPPYRDVLPWVRKAREAVESGDAGLVLGLVPVATDTTWFHDHVAGHAHVLFLKGRLRFEATPGAPGGTAKSPSMLVIWGGTSEQIRALVAAFPTAKHQPRTGWSREDAGAPPEALPAAEPPETPDPATACIELFAGGGSVHLAMREAGFTTAFANDLCPKKRKSYAANFPRIPLDGRDVRTLQGHQLPEAAILTGSSPCKDHSSNGARRGFAGERGGLAFEVIRLVGEMRDLGRAPKVVVFENVTGLLTLDEGREFATLTQALASAGYFVGGIVADGQAFVPQSRQRVFLVGVRNDMALPPSVVAARPTATWHPDMLRRAQAALSPAGRQAWRWWKLPRPPRRATSLADVLETVPPGKRWADADALAKIAAGLSALDLKRLAKARTSKVTVGIVRTRLRSVDGANVRGFEVHLDGHARCLMTTDRGDAQKLLFPDDTPAGFGVRSFTSRERARLTGLPDDYVLPGVGATTALTGDAIVVPVYSWLARHLLRPLAAASCSVPVVASPARRTRKPLDAAGSVVSGRKGIKGQTRNASLYLMPSTHERLFARAAVEGVSMTDFMLRLADRHLAALGELPLERYVAPPRRARNGGKRAARGGGIWLLERRVTRRRVPAWRGRTGREDVRGTRLAGCRRRAGDPGGWSCVVRRPEPTAFPVALPRLEVVACIARC